MNHVEIFVESIESMYTNYKSGMKEEIKKYFQKTDQYRLQQVFQVIKTTWEKDKSPSLANIIRISQTSGIPLRSAEYDIISICEFCFTGTQPVKKNDIFYSDYPYPEKSTWPKKIVPIEEATNWMCPICYNKPILGMSYKKYKENRKKEEDYEDKY